VLLKASITLSQSFVLIAHDLRSRELAINRDGLHLTVTRSWRHFIDS